MSDLEDLRDSVRRFLSAHAPVRAQLSDDASTWLRLTGELGLTSLAVPDSAGGAGGSFVELGVVLEEAGRQLLRAPLLSTAVVATVLAEAGATEYLAPLLDGRATAALALDTDIAVSHGRLTGTLPQIVDGAGASLLLVSTGEQLYVVESPQATPLQPLDPTRPQARITLDKALGHPVGDRSTSALAASYLQVALACECVGAARRCLELTVAHLLVREQFGRPLGSFQALRHRIADLTVALEGATSTAWYATQAAAGLHDDLPVAAPLALATCADAFTSIAGESIQLHGGIGFTWEHDAHLYFKRAWSTSMLHGDGPTLRRLAYARAGLDAGRSRS